MWIAGGAGLALLAYLRRDDVGGVVSDAANFVGGALADKAAIAQLIKAAAAQFGVDPMQMAAIVQVESSWNPAATNLSGPDGARGGAWGLSQITLQTAKAYGFTGSGEDLLDPATSIEWTARILAAGGPPVTIQDAGAWWNAGKKHFYDLNAESPTASDYVPKLVAALGDVGGILYAG